MLTPSRLSVGLFTLLLAACGDVSVTSGTSTAAEVDNRPQEIQAIPVRPHKALCEATGVAGEMHCMAKIRTDAAGDAVVVDPDATPAATIDGLTPSDLQAAYKLPSTGGSDMTVAIVDAQDNPSAEADLAVYRAHFGLPACTTANGCFKKVNQTGQQSGYPKADKGWAGEIALDLDMVSAACPNCKILLVEAKSASQDDLGAALNTAVSLGADAVSNSYGGTEDSSNATYDAQYFNHPGVAITVSAGDDGYGVEYPASSRYVTAVGGTSLAKSSGASRGWVESVWGSASNANGGTGSGCSGFTAKPSYQKDASCSKRMVADVAAVADPNTGVAVYDRYGSGGWVVIGGTSAASPLVASILALSHHTTDSLGYSYSHTSQFFDVTTGKNGSCSNYFCKGATGYDGPTGNGTPNATAMLATGSSSSSSSTTTSSGSSSSAGSTSGTSGQSGTTGSSGSALTEGVAVTGVSGASSSHTFFTFDVPAGATNVEVALSGGSGNANLYVKLGGTASSSSYDCRSTNSTNADSCTFTTSAGGTYSIELIANTAFSGVTIEGTYSTASGSTTGSTGSSGGAACRTCTSASKCDPGEHCIQNDASSGTKFCAADCSADHNSCGAGYSCDNTSGSSWACRPSAATCN